MINAGRVLIIPKGDYAPAVTYEMLDLVTFNGMSYIAKGTTVGNPPTNTTYWQCMSGDSTSIIGNFAPLETTNNATHEYVVGDYLVDLHQQLMKVTQDIHIGDLIVNGTNVEPKTVAELIEALETAIQALAGVAARLSPEKFITASVSLDTVTDIGEYAKSATGFFVTGAPIGIDSIPTATFRLRVERGSDGNNRLLQTLITDDFKVYTRAYKSSTWSAWKTAETKLTFDGTTAEWAALSNYEKALYRYVILTDE